MNKQNYPSFTSGKNITFQNSQTKKQNDNKDKFSIFSTKDSKKYLPDDQSARIILNYFLFNNFQDFNTWQQIAKTKTDYKFQQINSEKFECEISFKWQTIERENILAKAQARNKRNAKRKALTSLIETLIHKGWIGYGFKQKNFVEKLPRRKKYDSSSSEEQMSSKPNKNFSILPFIQQNKHQTLLESLNIQNIFQVWNYGLFTKNIQFCCQILSRLFGGNHIVEQNQSSFKFEEKQVSYVEQFKDPFQEDLTVFIRYYQLQRPKYQQKNLNRLQISSEKSVSVKFATSPFISQEKQFKLENFKQFQTIETLHDFLMRKKATKKQKKTEGFFTEDRTITIPKFEGNISDKTAISIKIVEKLYNQVLFNCQDLNFSIKVIDLLDRQLENVEFYYSTDKTRNNQEKDSISDEKCGYKRLQSYYSKSKKSLLIQMIYNLKIKLQSINFPRFNSIEGMLNYASSHSKQQGIFQFIPKQPEQIVNKKIQKKSNQSEFFEQNQFCTQQMVLLVNKLTQMKYIGLIKQLNQSFKIYVPFLVYEDYDFPGPFSIHKLLNSKVFNKISSSLIHACRYYLDQINSQIGKANNTVLIYQTPSTPHMELISQLLAEWISKKMFMLIVSNNYEAISKVLTQKGFKCLKISINCDQKIISKHNIILSNPLNICCDSLKNIAFDRIIIDQAHKVPQVINLLSVIRSTKKVYLIGDPNLPSGQMKCPLSRINKSQRSLFERFISQKATYLTMNENILNPNSKCRIFDNSIVQWLKKSIYLKDLITDQESSLYKRTPLIKGFNWPSNDYRICMINMSKKNQSQIDFINEQCFFINWIIAEILKSGFTELNQISCCSLSQKLIPVLQQHLIKILIKLGIQPLQWQIVFQSLVKPLDGSEENSNDLIILLASEGQDEVFVQNQIFKYTQMQKKLNASLLQAQRGIIIVGNVDILSNKNQGWSNFIDWMSSKRLILNYSSYK